MSEGMLGNLPLSEVRGPRGDLETKLASAEGEEWLGALKRFLRRENPWESEWRRIEELAIEIPALPRLAIGELRAKYSWIRSIEYDLSPTEAVTMRLGTLLRPGEERIGCKEYERRRKPHLSSCLGFQHAAWLVEHQDKFPEFMALLGKVYIDFLGMVVVDADGSRGFAYLGQVGERWYLLWYWTENDLDSLGRIARSSK